MLSPDYVICRHCIGSTFAMLLFRAATKPRTVDDNMRISQVCMVVAVLGTSSVAFPQESKPEITPPNKQVLPQRVRVSETVSRKLLIKKVAPVYPQVARRNHVHGTVVMNAVISREGDIQELTPVSGDPLLVPAAMEAVKKWKYKPYLLQGQPVEVAAQIMVTFAQ